MTEDTWTTTPLAEDPASAAQRLVAESGFRDSIVERARKRTVGSAPPPYSGWLVAGDPRLGDAYPAYQVLLDGRRYICACYEHSGGGARERRVCSHVVAVILARRTGTLPPAEMHREALLVETEKKPELMPGDLGLPFDQFRPQQLYALERLQKSKKKFLLLQGPCGSGKTLIACALQRLLRTKTLYCCISKNLQSQFMNDFKKLKDGSEYAVELKGRANYDTLQYQSRFPMVNASMCTKKKETHCRWCCDGGCGGEGTCLAKLRCPYERQKAHALASKQVVCINTSYLLSECNFVGGFSGWPLVCMDEADRIEQELLSFVELSISAEAVHRLALEPPRFKTKEEAWLEWISDQALPKVNERLVQLQSAYGVQQLREEEELGRLEKRLEFGLQEIPQAKWVLQTEDWERGPWVFKPVFVARYADHNLWRHGARWLLMSATIISPGQMARDLGIDEKDIEWVDLPSTFPADRRPIYPVPGPSLNHRNEAVSRPAVVSLLDKVLDRHPQERVLVHCVSYSLARLVLEQSRHKGRMVSYARAGERESALDQFRNGAGDRVLVACSMGRGVDLPDALCRAIVILKIPYPSLGDKQVSARLYGAKDGRSWYAVQTVREVTQATGRGMRHPQDYCSSYILDGEFARLFKEWKFLFPKWWLEAIRQPPPGLADGLARSGK